MAERVKLGERIKGGLNQNEDWWYFVDDGESKYVEHEWSYVDPFGKGKGSSGVKKIPPEEFLSSNVGEGLKNALRAALKGNS